MNSLGSAALWQLPFHVESDVNFPWEVSLLGENKAYTIVQNVTAA